MNYDIIGDIHGDADKLLALLLKLGYRNKNGAWRHHERQAIYVGDFIDRGPKQWEACSIVRRMIDAGSAQAIMGNHEFNAIAWFMKDEQTSGEHLRKHTEKNRKQHSDFLREVEGTNKHEELINWFLTLPLWLELPELRVIHACWHMDYIGELENCLMHDRTISKSLMVEASNDASMAFRTVEGLLKGLEIPLPGGKSFFDKSGHSRTNMRTRWWDIEANTYRRAALLDGVDSAELPDLEIPAEFRIGYSNDKPLFFGHYSMTGNPAILSSHIACVDYFKKYDNPLVAYQWDGEPELLSNKFVSV